MRRFVPPAPLIHSYWDYFRQRPLVYAAWFHLRRFKHYVRRKLNPAAWKELDFAGNGSKQFLAEKVLPYNKGMLGSVSRDRTERIMNVLRSIRGLDTKRSKVLCIGPRNEAEILLLSLYGFALKNITSIDLFSGSPLIRVMDMHDLEFGENEFDVIYSSFVITYSNDLRRACSEMVRVAKDSAILAIGYHGGSDHSDVGSPLKGGLKELFGCFGSHVKHVYWQEEYPISPKEVIATTIFSVSKSSAPLPEERDRMLANGSAQAQCAGSGAPSQ